MCVSSTEKLMVSPYQERITDTAASAPGGREHYRLMRGAEEGLDVSGKIRVVLEQKPVR